MRPARCQKGCRGVNKRSARIWEEIHTPTHHAQTTRLRFLSELHIAKHQLWFGAFGRPRLCCWWESDDASVYTVFCGSGSSTRSTNTMHDAVIITEIIIIIIMSGSGSSGSSSSNCFYFSKIGNTCCSALNPFLHLTR